MASTWQDDFVSAISSPAANDVNIDKAILIKSKYLPNTLFKYRNYNEHTLNALKTQTIYLSSPTTFNDPYDSSFSFIPEQTLSIILKTHIDIVIEIIKLWQDIDEDDIQNLKQSPQPLEIFIDLLLNKNKLSVV